MNDQICIYCERLACPYTATSWELSDMSDGTGPFISAWNLPIPQPTQDQLDAITDEQVAEWHHAADLAANGERWTLENRYIGYCDQLRMALGQQATQTKLGFEELEPMMIALKQASESGYRDLKDAMEMVNMALIRFDVKWWDGCVWHTEVEQ